MPSLVQFSSIRSYSIHIGCILSTLVLFGPHWSYLVHSVYFSPLQFYLGYSVLFGLFWSILSTLVLVCPHWSYSVQFDPIQSITSTLDLICPFILIRSPSILFGVNWPTMFYLVSLGLIRSTLFPFSSILSIRSDLFHFIQFGPFVSTLVQFSQFWSIFVDLPKGKRHVYVESTYFKSKFIKKYINLKLITFKILSIIFIVTILLLCHINIVFQTTSVRLNLGESLSKHECYVYKSNL